jgi:hypothetical protein
MAFVSNTSERSFVGLQRLRGSGRVGLWFTAIEPAPTSARTDHDVIFEVFDFLPLPFGGS